MVYRKQEQIKVIPHLGGGINNSDATSEIADFEMASCVNLEVDAKVLRSAAGHIDYGSDSATTPIYGGFEGRFEDGTHVMVRQLGAKLQYDDGTGTWTDNTTGGSSLTTTRCTFAMLNNIILWSNGTDTIKSSTDGETWTDQASLPKSKKIMSNGLNRILFVNQPATPSRINWSDINDPLTVQASAFQFIGKNDGEHVLDCVVTEQGGLYIFKTNTVYAIGDVTFDSVGVDVIGALPYIPFTAVSTNNSIMACGSDGVYEIMGGLISHITKKLDRSMFNITTTDTPVAAYFKNKYRVSLPLTSTHNDAEYVIDRKQMTGDPFHPYAVTTNDREIGAYIYEQNMDIAGTRHRLYVGGSVTGDYAWLNVDHDQGEVQGIRDTEQECEFETKYFTDAAPFFIKRFLRLFIDAIAQVSTDVTLCYRFDPVADYMCSTVTLSAAEFDWIYDSLEEGEWSGGFGFESQGADSAFISLNKQGVPRGVQFKITFNTKKDVSILTQAYKYITKPSFH